MKVESYTGNLPMLFIEYMSDLIQGYQTRQLRRSSQILLLKILNLV